MFLSRVEIPWESAKNPYDLHRQLWRLFPGEARETRSSDEEVRQGFLFRVEDCQTGRPARLLVQSRREPVAASGLVIVGTRKFHPQPVADQRIAFLLTANPVKTITDVERSAKPGKKSEKCRVPLIREDEQREWLTRKLAKAAEVEATSVRLNPPLFFRKGSRGGKLVTATFEGMLRVIDSTALGACLENGVGHGKAFGCGLLLVRRI